MNNLKKSEKILLAVAVLCVVAFAAYYFLSAPAGKKEAAVAQPNAVSAPVGGNVQSVPVPAQNAGPVPDEYVIAKAETAWTKNPFLDRESGTYKEWVVAQGAALGGTAAKIIYSGYIDAGKLKIAIINGLEYREGEQLETEGYVLEQVSPSQVLVANKNSGSEVSIPIQE